MLFVTGLVGLVLVIKLELFVGLMLATDLLLVMAFELIELIVGLFRFVNELPEEVEDSALENLYSMTQNKAEVEVWCVVARLGPRHTRAT